MGHKNYVPHVPQMGYKWGTQWGTKEGAEVNLLVKDGFICTPNGVKNYVPQMGYKWGTKWGTKWGAEIKLEI